MTEFSNTWGLYSSILKIIYVLKYSFDDILGTSFHKSGHMIYKLKSQKIRHELKDLLKINGVCCHYDHHISDFMWNTLCRNANLCVSLYFFFFFIFLGYQTNLMKNNSQTRPIDYPTDINKHTYIQTYYLTNDWEL